MEGTIFDIQRFSLHDGPGIRTTVFLKGCPFKCTWCCNPESISSKPQLAYYEDKCTQCFNCVQVCPNHALKIRSGKLQVIFDLCNACGNCIEECPPAALKIYGWKAESDEIIEEISKDIPYYKNSSGGLTLSGGDPLFQFDFAYDLLKKAKEKGIHTCLETEGFGSREQFTRLLPVVDLFYYDYKLTDELLHKACTGESNKSVLKNLEFLCRSRANLILRCIIIPGINDNEAHFKAIATLNKKYEAIKGIEVLPFHNFGGAKYVQIGRESGWAESGSVSPEVAEEWINRIRDLGGKNVVRG
jgi:glycyl-radical enzyme activating protein